MMVLGGGSSADGLIDGKAAATGRSVRTAGRSSGAAAAGGCGSRAAAEDSWQAGVQQSIREWSTGLAGMWLPMVQPGVAPGALVAAVAAAGLRASPRAQRKAMNSLITAAG